MESPQSRQERIVPWALKEWSSICGALAAGRQSLTLRKGGIEEESGEFRPEHSQFLLFPNSEHEKANALRPEDQVFLSQTPDTKDQIIFSLYAECLHAQPIPSKKVAQALSNLTIWTREYIGERFDLYPQKPLSLLVLRIYRLPEPLVQKRDPSYAGCRSWVPLVNPPAIPRNLEPVLSDESFQKVLRPIQKDLGTSF